MKTTKVDPLMLLIGKRPDRSAKHALIGSFDVALSSEQQLQAQGTNRKAPPLSRKSEPPTMALPPEPRKSASVHLAFDVKEGIAAQLQAVTGVPVAAASLNGDATLIAEAKPAQHDVALMLSTTHTAQPRMRAQATQPDAKAPVESAESFKVMPAVSKGGFLTPNAQLSSETGLKIAASTSSAAHQPGHQAPLRRAMQPLLGRSSQGQTPIEVVDVEQNPLTMAMQTWAQQALIPQQSKEATPKLGQPPASPRPIGASHLVPAAHKSQVDADDAPRSTVEQRLRRATPELQGPFAITVEQMLTRAKTDGVLTRTSRVASGSEGAKHPVMKLAEQRKPEPESATTTGGKAMTIAEGPVDKSPPVPFVPTTEPAVPGTPPAAIQDAAPLAKMAPLMLDDASLRAVLLPTIARVSIEAGESGRLNLELKVRDGVTELRAHGPAAPLLEARQGEIRVALAKEGLALGHFDLAQSGSQHHRQAERHEIELAQANAPRRNSSTEAVTEDGRIHVKA